MFAPEGYVPLSKVADNFLYDSADASFETAVKLTQEAESSGGIERAIDFFFRISPLDWAEASFFAALSDLACISSPNGTVLKLDIRAIHGCADFLSISIADLQDWETKKKLGPLPFHWRRSYQINDWPIEEFRAEYLKFRTKSKKSDNNSPWHFAAECNSSHHFHLLPLFYERVGMTITLQSFDFIEKADFIALDDFIEIARILRPFEGWAMCIPESAEEAVVSKLGASHDAVTQSVKNETDAFREAQEILRNDKSKSRRQGELRSMIKSEVGQRQWGRIVGRLRMDYPHISKPGAPRGKES